MTQPIHNDVNSNGPLDSDDSDVEEPSGDDNVLISYTNSSSCNRENLLRPVLFAHAWKDIHGSAKRRHGAI